MPTALLLLTYEFPFGNGETFLESEIGAIAEAFESVRIVPARAVWSTTWRATHCQNGRPIPDGCSVAVPSGQPLASHLLAAGMFWKALRHARFRWGSEAPLGYAWRIALRQAIKAAVLARWIRTSSGIGGKRCFGYAYWKSASAVALSLLKLENAISGFVARAHRGDLYYDILKHPCRPFDSLIADQSNAVIPISEHGASHLIDHGFPPDKVHLARLGVSMKPAAAASSDGILRLVSCSNIVAHKRVHLLADALLTLEFPFEWTHFGDGHMRAAVESKVLRFGANGKAVFPGRVPNRSVLQYYQNHAVDVFVNLSTTEGVPVSIMEALAAGIPCIATDVGGTSELVDESCGALLASDVDCHTIAAVLASVRLDGKSWLQKRQAARDRALARCNAEVNYKRFADWLIDLATQTSETR